MDQQPTCSSKYTHIDVEAEDIQETKPLSPYAMYILPKNSEHDVYVSHAENGPLEFWIQLDSTKHLLSLLKNAFNNIILEPLKCEPTIGTACIVNRDKSTDLCRGMVIDIQENICKVLLVDYGNISNFCCKELYAIPEDYIRPKVMASRYTLAESQKLCCRPESLKAFRKFHNNKLLKMLVVEEGTLDSLPVCELRDIRMSAIDFIKSSLMVGYLPCTAPSVPTDVVISYVRNCAEFYIQEKSTEKELLRINAIVQQNCRTAPSINGSQLVQGLPCCAMSPVDNKWHRTKVLWKDNEFVKISYVDYGDEHTVRISDLKMPSTSRLTATSPLAVKCSLSGYDDRKDTQASEALYKLISEKEFKLKVIEYKDSVPQVELLDEEGQSVTEALEKQLRSLSLESGPKDQMEE